MTCKASASKKKTPQKPTQKSTSSGKSPNKLDGKSQFPLSISGCGRFTFSVKLDILEQVSIRQE